MKNKTAFIPLKIFALILLTCLLLFSSKKLNSQTLKELNSKLKESYRNGDYEAAIKYGEKLVEKAKKELGEDHQDYDSYVYNLGSLYFKIEDYANAKITFDYLIRKEIVNLTLSQREFLIALFDLALSCEKTKDFENALTCYKLLNEMYKPLLEKTDNSYLSSLIKLGSAYQNVGDFQSAVPIYIDLLSILKSSTGEDVNYADVSLELGNVYDTLGLYNNALLVYNDALRIREIVNGENNADYIQVLNKLGFLYYNMGNYANCETMFKKALKIRKEILGEDHYLYASSLNNLAGLYLKTGNFSKAESLFIKALEIRKTSVGETNILTAGSVNNLAVLYYSMGDYGKAIPLYLKAIELYKKISGETHPDYGNALNNLAQLYSDIGGEYAKAESLFLEAIEIQKNAVGESNTLYATYLNNLGTLYTEHRDYNKAEPLLQKSAAIQKQMSGENHPDYATTLNSLGLLYLNKGNYSKAEQLFKEAVNILKNQKTGLKSIHAPAMNNLAGLYHLIGDYVKSEALFSETKKILLQDLRENFSFLSEAEKESFAATLSFQFKLYQNFYLGYNKIKPSVAGEAYDIELATKGMILNSGIQMRQNIKGSGNPEALKLYDAWVAQKSILAKQYALPEGQRTLDVSEVENKANDLEKQLTILSSSYKESENILRNEWTDIQKKLGPGEVAIEFTSFQRNNKQNLVDTTVYVALVLRKGDAFPVMIPLCESRQLENLLKKDKSTDAGFISGLYRGSELLNPTIDVSNGKLLYQLIWKPIDSLLSKGNKIYFAPSGLLHQIAFAAIPYDDKTLVSDRYTLSQLSTTAILLRQSQFSDTIPKSMTLYGGIRYQVSKTDLLAITKTGNEFVSRSLPADERKKETWNYLPGTLAEANAIANIANQKNINVKLYSDKEAREETFKNIPGNNSPRVIHIATHGFFFPDSKENKTSENGNKKVFHSSEDPLNRAGLLFAGANNSWNGDTLPEGIEDGILTAFEATNVTLNNTQLVVLSACETGLGEIKGSEGVFGLQRAFKMAGAEYLMMSLWKVPDSETAEFMSKFYSTWFGGKTIPDAFVIAQNFMKSKYPKEPYKWAAFVLVK